MRFHVCALPHTRTSKEFCSCAYTGKILRFCSMMKSLGHTVYHYGAEGSEADCTEHISVITSDEQAQFFGSDNWHEQAFTVSYDPKLPYWELVNLRTAAEIRQRLRREDFLCLIGGLAQKPIADLVGESDSITVEYGVGYYGYFAKYRVFESYTHQAACYAMRSPDPNGFLYDTVIPNYFDTADFPAGPGGNYLLYVGRLIHRKGVQIAIETAEAAGMRLLMAGTGLEVGVHIPSWVECVGHINVQERAFLMGGARALIAPTLFMEPFGGVAVESQLCGTAVISTNFAAFSETVEQGVTGFRCHTLEQFVRACNNVRYLDRAYIRARAQRLYGMDRVRHMYDGYFAMLSGLWGAGWPTLSPRLRRVAAPESSETPSSQSQ